jgi:DNA-binding response OmpR family regulator
MASNRNLDTFEYINPKDAINFLEQENIYVILLSSKNDVNKLQSIKNNRNTNNSKIKSTLVMIEIALIPQEIIFSMFELCDELNLPILALVPYEDVISINDRLSITDFIVTPAIKDELLIRCNRIINKNFSAEDTGIVIRNELIINPTNYEVTIKGKRINLRFKEYELLLLLASNPGRVYDRATLLNQIWGYDYFGGTRTVDVHIRRLRSKIETDPENPYIETIWNVGYRFRTSA